MKKFFYSIALLFAAVSFTACSSSNDEGGGGTSDVKEAALKLVTTNYVEKTVYTTYQHLANYTDDLYTRVKRLRDYKKAGTLTDNEIYSACEKFLAARAYWEKTEAWLYGPAEVFGIDPHIDTWPMDPKTLSEFFTNGKYAEIFESGLTEEQQVVKVSELNNEDSFLGFHGLEFILFRAGKERMSTNTTSSLLDDTDSYTKDGVTYTYNNQRLLDLAAAIAGDLRDCCSRLECAWMGADANPTHIAYCAARGFELTQSGLYQGPAMLTPPNALYTGNGYLQMIPQIIAGCNDIAQEVQDQKMGQVYRVCTGSAEKEDSKDYIESPYSHKSFKDFYDNTLSIQYALYGGEGNTEPAAVSVVGYLKAYNPTLATEIENQIKDVESALKECSDYKSMVEIAETADQTGLQKMKAAMDELGDLQTVLSQASDWITSNY